MKSFLNSWFVRYLVIFLLTAILLVAYKQVYDRFEYFDYSGHTVKIDKRTGELYQFKPNAPDEEDWVLVTGK
ncbi:hypothetical protein [Paenibacillus silvisoli]|uniref:hypothetical protein n=1 Tax=Paenibacillus silvisoli TaxID=3110539 RepID=UPI0028055726|nr:hypothetical protein [Paenibacillus silvisoli]